MCSVPASSEGCGAGARGRRVDARAATAAWRAVGGADDATLVGEGDDFRVFAVADGVLRFPKHAAAARALAVEHHLLARLDLGVLIPRHQRCFPGPWVLATRLRGAPGDGVHAPSDALGVALGRVLARLHAVTDAPVPVDRRTWDPRRYRGVVARELAAVAGRDGPPDELLQGLGLDPAQAAPIAAWWRTPPPPPGPATTLVHGDLDPEHLLVDGDALVGVIDWTDARIADPARDLAAVLSWGGPGLFAAAASAYPVATLDRGAAARVVELSRLCSIDAWFSTRGGPLHGSAAARLAHAFADDGEARVARALEVG